MQSKKQSNGSMNRCNYTMRKNYIEAVYFGGGEQGGKTRKIAL